LKAISLKIENIRLAVTDKYKRSQTQISNTCSKNEHVTQQTENDVLSMYVVGTWLLTLQSSDSVTEHDSIS